MGEEGVAVVDDMLTTGGDEALTGGVWGGALMIARGGGDAAAQRKAQKARRNVYCMRPGKSFHVWTGVLSKLRKLECN